MSLRLASVHGGRLFGVPIAVCLLLAGASARADDGVKLTRETPWDAWCVQPLCTDKAHAREPLVTAPPSLPSQDVSGLASERLKRALTDTLIDAAAKLQGPWNNEATVDMAHAIAAAASKDVGRVSEGYGLGPSIARAGLAYALDAILPRDAACVGSARTDAIYEGLGITVVLAPLQFPLAKGSVPSVCAATAHASAKFVDRAVATTILAGDVGTRIAPLTDAFDKAQKACASAPPPASLVDACSATDSAVKTGTVTAAVDALHKLRGPALAADPTSSVSAPLQVLASTDPALLDTIAKEGFGPVPLIALGTALRDPVIPCDGAGECARRDAALRVIAHLAASRGLGREDLIELVKALVASIDPEATPMLKDGFLALTDTIVDVEGGGVTLDPAMVASALVKKYGGVLGVDPLKWIVEVNGGIPVLSQGQTKIAAEGRFGYSGENLGVTVRGGIDYYDVTTTIGEAESDHPYGGLDAWWISGTPQSTLRLEIHLGGAVDYYDTTTILSNPPPGSVGFLDFDSLMFRGALSLGLRYGSPSDRFSAQILGGAGGQFETQDTTSFLTSIAFDSQNNVSAYGTGHVLLHLRAIPQILGMRLRGDTIYFKITRDDLTFTSAGAGAVAVTATQNSQTELHGRLFLDADVASFFGFVPALFGGIDYVGISGTSSPVTPILGAGIVRAEL